MSRPLNPVVLSSVTTSAWIPLDIYEIGQVQIDCSIIGGPPTFQVDYTDDDVFNPAVTPSVTGQAVATGAVAVNTKLTWVPRAIRLNMTGGSGSVTMKVIQQGVRGG